MNNYRLAMTNLYVLIFILTFFICSEYKAWGAVPPPPVNQLIGIVDSIFQNSIEADCRICHDQGLPDRHHLLIDMIIPDPTNSPFGIPGSPYGCLSCHAEDISSGIIVFLVERDCLVCHIYIHGVSPFVFDKLIKNCDSPILSSL